MSRIELKRGFLRGLFAATGQTRQIPELTVGAVMTPSPFTVSANCSARQLVEFFHQKQFRHFLVTDNGRLAGIISDRDVIPYFGDNSPLESEEFTKVTAADLMSTDLIVVQPAMPLAAAIEQMVDSGINSLPVVDGVETVGILTSTDIFLSFEQLLYSAVPALATAN